MFEQVKLILTTQYQNEINRFDELKKEIEDIEYKMKDETSEIEYKEALKELNKKYSLFKRHGKQYKEELKKIQSKYYKELKAFKNLHDKYVDLRREASLINIYVIQKKLEQLNNANSLEDIRMTEEEANKIISESV